MKKVTIRSEEEKDYREVESLVRDAFWNVYRPGAYEHYVLHRMRSDKDFISALDFVMELDGKIIGQVVYYKSSLKTDDGRTLPVATFGPICIANEYKRKGYGKILLDYSVEKAKELGISALFITGNIDFYGKSGFVTALSKNVRYADDPTAGYFLVKELQSGFLDGISGTYEDPDCYFVCEKDPDGFAKYEATFPEKERLKLDGQLF